MSTSTASTQLRALEGEIADMCAEELRTGLKEVGHMFAQIMATAITGLADAAIIEHKTYTAEDTLTAVKQLAELTQSLRTENATLKRRLDEAKQFITDLNIHAQSSGDSKLCKSTYAALTRITEIDKL